MREQKANQLALLCKLQYDCVCLPVAMEEENMLLVSAVGLAEVVAQPVPQRLKSASALHFTSCLLSLQSPKLKKIVPSYNVWLTM